MNDACAQIVVAVRSAMPVLVLLESAGVELLAVIPTEKGIDCDARSVSVTQCYNVTAIPDSAEILKALGGRWCALATS